MGKRKNKDRLAITVCATKSYLYATRSQARRVAANLEGAAPGLLVFVGDGSDEFNEAVEYWKCAMPAGWAVDAIGDPAFTEHKNYKESAQLVLARMRTLAFSAARKWGASRCWSLDSDVLPPANALEVMGQMLEFDGGYYGVSTCSYPNDAFLGGHGTQANPISPSVYPDEMKLPAMVSAALELAGNPPTAPTDAQARKWKGKPPMEHRKARIEGWILRRDYEPKGNVFELNAKGWRPRGWFEHAYPGIGRGSVVPVDWCGFGCTLLGREALAHCHFEGYEGKGTEDLWVCFKQWAPAGIRINCISHVVCDHVINLKKKAGGETGLCHIRAFHELEGPSAGHLRTEKTPWLYD